MSKRVAILVLSGVAALTLLAGFAVIRKFPLKSGGALSAASNWNHNGVIPPLKINPVLAKAGPFVAPGAVSAPVPIFKPDPPYTKQARSAKIQGTVVLWIVVGDDGLVKDVRVIKSLDPGLDRSAVETVKTWKYQPTMIAGKRVPVRVMVEASFGNIKSPAPCSEPPFRLRPQPPSPEKGSF